MKNKRHQIKSTLKKLLTIVAAGFSIAFSCTIQSQNANFDSHGWIFGASCSGKVAFSDSANSICWNPIVKNSATPFATGSDGVLIDAITLTINYSTNYNSVEQGAATLSSVSESRTV